MFVCRTITSFLTCPLSLLTTIESARRRLSLREVISGLSKAESDWKGALQAVQAAEMLVRAAPDELPHQAGALVGVGGDEREVGSPQASDGRSK